MSKDAKSMIWDYLVFVIFVIASTFVAVYSRFFGPKEKTKADFVFAAGKVSMAAMMLSIARGTLGVRSFLGYPSELFYRGSTMWETLYGMVLAYPIVCFVFVPVYFSLGITSVYQYLDLRFKSRLVRCLASGTYIVRQLLNQGVTVFTPCVALNTVIGIPYWASIFGITLVSIIFTILGGLKAAILADVMQGLTMIAVSLAIIIQGCIEVGGFGAVFERNKADGRLDFLKTLMYNIPVITVLFSLSWVVGMVVYATYASCDPYTSGYIEKFDEVLPFFVEDRFNYLPGILGLFMASLFNGALSLNVSNLNSLATVTFEDFLRPIPYLKGLKDKHQLYTIKAIAVLYGFVIMGISFGVGLLDGVIESSMLVTSATSGPLLGVFIMALLIPCTNWKGASIGVITGHLVTLWITFGRLTTERPPTPLLPLSADGCTNSSFNDHILKPEHQTSFWTVTTTTPTPVNNTGNFSYDIINTTRAIPSDPLTQLYSVTYMYYSLIGCFISILIGWTVSYFTGSESDLYDQELIHPVARKMANFFPGKKRRYAEKNFEDKTFRGSINLSASAASVDKKNGNANLAFAQDIPMEQTEVYKTKL
ncbi:sodium-coupled monocarboxylate transporter 1 [Asbolus verrucosus]|uniref:Sodium-coupled monocarboxylate transporter 1 n=1 Tax=Asbolus verrucosus TaxID=1661398 RepID=A0A482VYH7_ASBVE|nr:sodium-coupled monocarboxylate transporter 1 [Asbolus verrucosus]